LVQNDESAQLLMIFKILTISIYDAAVI